MHGVCKYVDYIYVGKTLVSHSSISHVSSPKEALQWSRVNWAARYTAVSGETTNSSACGWLLVLIGPWGTVPANSQTPPEEDNLLSFHRA